MIPLSDSLIVTHDGHRKGKRGTRMLNNVCCLCPKQYISFPHLNTKSKPFLRTTSYCSQLQLHHPLLIMYLKEIILSQIETYNGCRQKEREREEKRHYCSRDRCPYSVEGEMDVYPVLLRGYTMHRCLACEGCLSLLCAPLYNPPNWHFAHMGGESGQN